MILHVTQRTALRRPFDLSVRPSVRLSARLSVKRVLYDKTKETCVHILISHKRTFILVFRYEEWLVEDDFLYLKVWAKLTPFEQKRRFSIDISSHRLSGNT